MHRLRADVQRELDRTGRKRVHKIDEELGRDGDRAFVLYFRWDPAVDSDLQVRRRQAEPSGIRTEKDVAEDRQAASRRDPPAGHRETVSEVLL